MGFNTTNQPTRARRVFFSGGSLDSSECAMIIPLTCGHFIYGTKSGSEIYHLAHNVPEEGMTVATFAPVETGRVQAAEAETIPQAVDGAARREGDEWN